MLVCLVLKCKRDLAALGEESLLQQLMAFIQLQYTNSVGEGSVEDYVIGQPCVAKYSFDQLFYRGQVLDITPDGKIKASFKGFFRHIQMWAH